MNRTDELKVLFGEWQNEHSFDIFCSDGIVDEENFGKDIPEVVFLLKDANVTSDEDSDVCANLLATAKGEKDFLKMWKVLCMWAKIMENPDIRFEDCCTDKGDINDEIRAYLSQIAVVNLSKEHGKDVNNQDELNAKLVSSVKKYYDFTRREIRVINPSIVVCCGTYYQIKDEYGVYDNVTPSGVRYFRGDGTIYLEMCHPAAYISYQMLFAFFKEVYSDFWL